jgi:hypothetical protein
MTFQIVHHYKMDKNVIEFNCGSFTLAATFVSETVGDSATEKSLDCHDSTCLGHLRQCDTDRIISVGQGEYIRRNIMGVIVRNIPLNFANVSSAFALSPSSSNPT